MDRDPKPPFYIDCFDQFEGGYGYSDEDKGEYWVGVYQRLEDAIAEAKRITDESIAEFHSFEKWVGMGDAGMVYDSK